MDILADDHRLSPDEGYKLCKRLSCIRPPLESLGSLLTNQTIEELNLLILRLPSVPEEPPSVAENDTSSSTLLIKATNNGAQALVSGLGWLAQKAWGGGGKEKT